MSTAEWKTDEWRQRIAKRNTKLLKPPPFLDIRTLILGGGGARCITFVGVIEALRRNGMDFADVVTRIVGTSAGAMCALFVALRVTTDSMIDSIVKVAQMEMDGLLFMREGYFNDMGDLRATLETALVGAGLPKDATMEQLQTHTGIEVGTVSVDLVTGDQLLQSSWATPDAAVVDVIADSMRLPILFPSRDTETAVVVDGGVINSYPIDFAHDPATTFGMRVGSDPAEIKAEAGLPVAPAHTMTSSIVKLKRILELFLAAANYRVFGGQYNAMKSSTLFLDAPFLSITNATPTKAEIDAALQLGHVVGQHVAILFLEAPSRPEASFVSVPMLRTVSMVRLIKDGLAVWMSATSTLRVTLPKAVVAPRALVEAGDALRVTRLQLVFSCSAKEDEHCGCDARFDMLIPPSDTTFTRTSPHEVQLEAVSLEDRALQFDIVIRGDGGERPCDATFERLSVGVGLSAWTDRVTSKK